MAISEDYPTKPVPMPAFPEPYRANPGTPLAQGPSGPPVAAPVVGGPVSPVVVMINQLPEEDLGDLTPTEAPFKIGGKRYLLREASGAAKAQWQNAQIRAAKFDEDGKPTNLGNLADSEILLISLCLFPVNEVMSAQAKYLVAEPIPVKEVEIKQWRSSITTRLHEVAMRISGLAKPKTEDELEKVIDEAEKELTKLRAAKKSGNTDPVGNG